jgi:hypothetical protein
VLHRGRDDDSREHTYTQTQRQSADATERRYPARGAYASPGEDEDSISGRGGEHGSVYAASESDSLVARKQVVIA